MKKHIKLIHFWRTYKGLIKLGIILLIILMLFAGCTINTAANDFCYLYRPVYADYENDTAETIQQIDQNNVAYEALCIK